MAGNKNLLIDRASRLAAKIAAQARQDLPWPMFCAPTRRPVDSAAPSASRQEEVFLLGRHCSACWLQFASAAVNAAGCQQQLLGQRRSAGCSSVPLPARNAHWWCVHYRPACWRCCSERPRALQSLRRRPTAHVAAVSSNSFS